METVIHLDTHVVVWLYLGSSERFTSEVIERIETCDVVISPVVSLELQYLHEIGRLKPNSTTVIKDLSQRIGLSFSKASLENIIGAATDLTWTRDPFDRLIVGNAIADRVWLVTADSVIRNNFRRTFWR
jgi:PIN domain nuclease of toxin-antitoxin system